MRKRSSVAVLDLVGVCALRMMVGLLSVGDVGLALADSSVIIEIPDNPVTQDGDGAQAPPSEAEENVAEPAPPQDLFIAEAIAQKLGAPTLQKAQHPDDVAAVEAFYKARSGPALWLTSAGLSPKGLAVLEALAKADDWGLEPALFRVPPADYSPSTPEDQAATELAISLAALKYARAAKGGLSDPNTISKIYELTPTVHTPETVMKDLASASAPDSVLTGLHPKHEQFTRLRQALAKTNSEDEDLRLRRNMDRWRWMPDTLGSTYVWLNIPEFTVHVVEDGKTVQSENVVVGGVSTPTPVLTADMTEIVFNPERVVPQSVIRRDVLPKLRGSGSFFGGGSTAILDKYGITVKRRSKTVDPKTIDWKKVNPSTLTFVQKPGRTNILGKVQFLYPNDRKVFMRDTILRGQLAREVRAEGAKDPRVANPNKLAARLLAKSNGVSAAKVSQMISGGKTNRIKLSKPIPVHMTYFTAIVDEAGTLETFEDVYKLDALRAPEKASSAPAEQTSSPTAGEAPTPARKPINGSLATSSP